MKPGPEVSDNRSNADNSLRRAKKLPPGREKQSPPDRSDDDAAQAHSNDWRRAHLHAPD
jgi:hypothetical protein